MTKIANSQSKELTVAQESPLSLQIQPKQTWANALEAILPEGYDSEISTPAELADKVGGLSSIPPDLRDKIVRAQVKSEMLSQITPDSKQALDRLRQDMERAVDPIRALESDQICARVATLIACDRVPWAVVFTEVAKAGRRNGDGAGSLFELYFTACEGFANFVGSRDGQPKRPIFNHDEFSRMAEYCRKRGLKASAEGFRKFWLDDQVIPLHLIDAFIHMVLEECEIWDPRRHDGVTVSNRLVTEVRGAFARKYPRPPTADIDAMAPKLNIATLSAPTPCLVSTFAEEELFIAPGEWTSSNALWSAWTAWCIRQRMVGTATNDRAHFFRQLSAWGADRIRRTKPRGSARSPGYEGLALQKKNA